MMSESSSEDYEPLLRYQRLGGCIPQLLAKDTISALSSCSKFLVVGTHWGQLLVTDFNGNEIKRWRGHSATVNCISIIDEYVGSAGDDGRVVVQSVFGEDLVIVDYSRPMKALALDPEYGKTRRFASGGMAGQVVLHEANWLTKKETDTVLWNSTLGGPIQSAVWKGPWVVWGCDEGVQIYDMGKRQRAAQVQRIQQTRADLYRCRLEWQQDLVVGWGNVVQVVRIAAEGGAEIRRQFRTEGRVAGVSQYRRGLLVLSQTEMPELQVIDQEEVSSDMLTVEGHQVLQANDMGLVAAEEGWYMWSPRGVLKIRERGLSEHVEWLVTEGREMYDRALRDIEESYEGGGEYRGEVDRGEYQRIGELYAEQLMDEGDIERAAQVCARVLPRTDDREAWETWVFRLAEAGGLGAIAEELPTKQPVLSGTAYEMVLANLLTSDLDKFQQLVGRWDSHLYDGLSVALACEDQLEKSPDNKRLMMECLAVLYDRLNQPNKSLKYHLELFTEGCVERIREENLFDAVRDKVRLLMLYDDHFTDSVALEERCGGPGIQLLIDYADSIPPQTCVQQLLKHPEHLHWYLHALLKKAPQLCAPFADLQIELYAEFNQSRLLEYLRGTSYYSFDKALQVCQDRDLVREMVYVLGRMGDTHRALWLIIERLGDVREAIGFAQEQGDPELWRDVVMYGRDKPEFVLGLLKHTKRDLVGLIKMIPAGLEVAGIQEALVSVLRDAQRMVELSGGCRRVMEGDVGILGDKLRKLQHRGISVNEEQMCLVCQEPLEELAMGVMWWCGHVFHDKCLLVPEVLEKTRRVQGTLDKCWVLRQYKVRCPVCREITRSADQPKVGWSSMERKDSAATTVT